MERLQYITMVILRRTTRRRPSCWRATPCRFFLTSGLTVALFTLGRRRDTSRLGDGRVTTTPPAYSISPPRRSPQSRHSRGRSAVALGSADFVLGETEYHGNAAMRS